MHPSLAGVATFIGAGLIDGMSPYAMVVVLFFLWFVFSFCQNGGEFLAVGICFIMSVFLTMSLVELGVFEKFRILEIYELLVRVFFQAVAVMMLILGFSNFRDWKRCVEGKKEGACARLPFLLQAQAPRHSRAVRSKISLIAISIVSGFIFSFLASVCRGQPFLTMLAYTSGAQNQKLTAFLYVVVYNLLAILPLVSIFFVVLWLLQLKGLAERVEKNFSKIKIINAGVLFGLGFGLLYMLL